MAIRVSYVDIARELYGKYRWELTEEEKKEVNRVRAQRYYQLNKELHKKRVKKWRSENMQRYSRYQTKYIQEKCAADKEFHEEFKKRRRERNKERWHNEEGFKERALSYGDPEKKKKTAQEYYQRNKEKYKQRQKEYRERKKKEREDEV